MQDIDNNESRQLAVVGKYLESYWHSWDKENGVFEPSHQYEIIFGSNIYEGLDEGETKEFINVPFELLNLEEGVNETYTQNAPVPYCLFKEAEELGGKAYIMFSGIEVALGNVSEGSDAIKLNNPENTVKIVFRQKIVKDDEIVARGKYKVLIPAYVFDNEKIKNSSRAFIKCLDIHINLDFNVSNPDSFDDDDFIRL